MGSGIKGERIKWLENAVRNLDVRLQALQIEHLRIQLVWEALRGACLARGVLSVEDIKAAQDVAVEKMRRMAQQRTAEAAAPEQPTEPSTPEAPPVEETAVPAPAE